MAQGQPLARAAREQRRIVCGLDLAQGEQMRTGLAVAGARDEPLEAVRGDRVLLGSVGAGFAVGALLLHRSL